MTVSTDPPPANASPTPAGARSFLYAAIEATDLYIHLFTPADWQPTDRRPAILFFFGGGWALGSVEQFAPHARRLAARGMVAAVADYRVRNRHGSTPFESLADARAAFRWMQVHAGEQGVDPERIAAGGGSAGGHLALCLHALPDALHGGPDALVLLNPILDTRAPEIAAMAARHFDAATVERLAELSPFACPPMRAVPMLLVNGTADELTRHDVAARYCVAVNGTGGACAFKSYDGAGHAFWNAAEMKVPAAEGGRWFAPVLSDIERFLVKIGYLEAEAPSAGGGRRQPHA